MAWECGAVECSSLSEDLGFGVPSGSQDFPHLEIGTAHGFVVFGFADFVIDTNIETRQLANLVI